MKITANNSSVSEPEVTSSQNSRQSPKGSSLVRYLGVRIRVIVVGGLAGLFTLGCLPTTLNPFFGPENQVFDSGLIGTWEMEDDKDLWVFKAGDEKSYELTISNDEGSGKFEARLGMVGEHRFLDLFPDGSALEEGHHHWMYMVLLYPTHTFFQISLDGDQCRLKCLDLDKLVEWMKENPEAITHHIFEDERVLLTGTTAELQEFVSERLKDAELWATIGLVRK